MKHVWKQNDHATQIVFQEKFLHLAKDTFESYTNLTRHEHEPKGDSGGADALTWVVHNLSILITEKCTVSPPPTVFPRRIPAHATHLNQWVRYCVHYLRRVNVIIILTPTIT